MRKIKKIAISSDLCIRLAWNLTGSCGQQQRLRGWSHMVVKQFQDGGRPPFWKSLYRHISAKNHPISMKFCTQQQILNWMNVTSSQMKKLHWTDSDFDRTYFLFGNVIPPIANRSLFSTVSKKTSVRRHCYKNLLNITAVTYCNFRRKIQQECKQNNISACRLTTICCPCCCCCVLLQTSL